MPVHVLVLEAFVGPRPARLVCRHLDGNYLNNSILNLAWGTCSENNRDRFRHGFSTDGEKNSQARLTGTEVLEMRNLFARGLTQAAIARRCGISYGNVHMIVRRKSWIHLPDAQAEPSSRVHRSEVHDPLRAGGGEPPPS